MNAYEDRVAETERVKERKRARVESGAGDVPEEPWKQMADRHAVASGSEEEQHEENIMIDIQIGKRGSETANEEQPDKWTKTVRFEQEAPNTSSPSFMYVSLEYPASGERPQRPEPVHVRNSSHVDDDIQISALDVFCEMHGRKSRCIKDVLGWHREEDAGDLKRNELNESVENMTCLNAFEVKIWKSETSWKT